MKAISGDDSLTNMTIDCSQDNKQSKYKSAHQNLKSLEEEIKKLKIILNTDKFKKQLEEAEHQGSLLNHR